MNTAATTTPSSTPSTPEELDALHLKAYRELDALHLEAYRELLRLSNKPGVFRSAVRTRKKSLAASLIALDALTTHDMFRTFLTYGHGRDYLHLLCRPGPEEAGRLACQILRYFLWTPSACPMNIDRNVLVRWLDASKPDWASVWTDVAARLEKSLFEPDVVLACLRFFAQKKVKMELAAIQAVQGMSHHQLAAAMA